MDDAGEAMPADRRVHYVPDSSSPSQEVSHISSSHAPHSLRDALRTAEGGTGSNSTESTSEEDYDDRPEEPVAVVVRRRKGKDPERANPRSRSGSNPAKVAAVTVGPKTPSDISSEVADLDDEAALKVTKLYTVASDDKELRAILKRGMQRVSETCTNIKVGVFWSSGLTATSQAKESDSSTKRKGRFRDYVFTKKFSTFDKRNEIAATSPFHGFFTLFWIAVAFFMLKIGAENWKKTGSPLGTNEIIKSMLKRDVMVLLLSDGILCGSTAVSWILQVLIRKGHVDWDRSGWILQNVWQSIFIGANIGWTHFRDWPWSHTVFFVLHTLIMLMKQHSYAFYNGYLSAAYKKREELFQKLKQLEQIEAVDSPSSNRPTASAVSPEYLNRRPSVDEIRQRRRSLNLGMDTFSNDLEMIDAAIESNKSLNLEQIHIFEKVIQWEIDGLTEELLGKSTSPQRAYPNNLTLNNYSEYIVFPTLVYELEYPRSESIDWRYVGEKVTATFGVIFVMIMVSQALIYPVVVKTIEMKESGMTPAERLMEFPWLFLELIFPFMMEFLLAWYLIWEAILNVLGEVTYFADREFYSDWWNSVSWDQYARDWNRPVHNFLLRHVYHSSISTLRVNKYTATIITFFLSSLVHELVMWCIFKKVRGYFLAMQMLQIPVSDRAPRYTPMRLDVIEPGNIADEERTARETQQDEMAKGKTDAWEQHLLVRGDYGAINSLRLVFDFVEMGGIIHPLGTGATICRVPS